MQPRALSIHARPIEHGEMLAVAGELDVLGAAELRAALADVDRKGSGGVALDLRGVGFIDSMGLASLLNARRRLLRQRRPFVLVAPKDGPVSSLLRLSRLDQDLFSVERPEEAEAVLAQNRLPRAAL